MVQTTYQIAASYTQTSFEARTVLYLVYGEEFSVDLPPLNGLVDSTLLSTININFKNEASSSGVKEEAAIVLYPNPASNLIHIGFDNTEYLEAEIKVYTSFGQLVYKGSLENSSISTENFENCIHFYNIIYEGNIVKKGKLIILK